MEPRLDPTALTAPVAYVRPLLRRLGSAAELTQSRSMIGMMDGGGGGGGMNRTG